MLSRFTLFIQQQGDEGATRVMYRQRDPFRTGEGEDDRDLTPGRIREG